MQPDLWEWDIAEPTRQDGRKMPLWFHDLYTDGIHPDARFPRDRYRRLLHRLLDGEASHWLTIETAPLADRNDLLRAHDEAYVDRFLAGIMSEKEIRRIGLRPWTPSLIPRTLHIMGGAMAALRFVAESNGIAGNMAGGTHHAHHAYGAGYCVFNDLAICARLATQSLGFQRVSILDLDVHQGDGTATIFWEDPSVRTISVHCAENFPFRKQPSDFDFPVHQGTGDERFGEVVNQALERAMDFQPDLLLFQGGVDGLATDGLGRLNLSRLGMRKRNRVVYEAVLREQIPCVVFMGGGYSKPIEPTIDAFVDLFVDAAMANRWVL